MTDLELRFHNAEMKLEGAEAAIQRLRNSIKAMIADLTPHRGDCNCRFCGLTYALSTTSGYDPQFGHGFKAKPEGSPK